MVSRTALYSIIAALTLFGAFMTVLFYQQGTVIDGMLRCVLTSGIWA